MGGFGDFSNKWGLVFPRNNEEGLKNI